MSDFSKLFIFLSTLSFYKVIIDSRKLVRTEAVIREDVDSLNILFKVNNKGCNFSKITGIKEQTVRVNVSADNLGAECNKELATYVADVLNISHSNVSVIKGYRSLLKTVAIESKELKVLTVVNKFIEEVASMHPEPWFMSKVILKG